MSTARPVVLGPLALLWAAPRTRACLLVAALYLAVAAAGVAHLLPDPEATVGGAQQPPGWPPALWLGTDLLGRSVAWRVLAGAQVAVALGGATVLLAVPFGTVLGLAAGYLGGRVDAIVQWLYAVLSSVPDILLVAAVSYAMGRGLPALCVALAATHWTGTMRLVRAEAQKLRGSGWVLAARAAGAGAGRVMVAEILPNVLHVVIATATLVLLAAVKAEVILSYLGLGVQEGTSWGLLIAGAVPDLLAGVRAPLVGTVLAMGGWIYALSVLGDALRDVLDPRVD